MPPVSALVPALWLGAPTSISPCPLAMNIAAVSFVGKHVGYARRVLLSGIACSLGRVAGYVVVCAVVVAGIFSIPAVSKTLQKYMLMIVGPFLILAGMFLLELTGTGFSGPSMSSSAHKIAGRGGVAGAASPGFLFALSFRPVSAALFSTG